MPPHLVWRNRVRHWRLLFRDGLCLPSGTAMSEGDQMRVVDVIRTQINRTQMNAGCAHR